MPLEIERKFLTVSEAWRPLVTQSLSILDGLLIAGEGRKLRVRLQDDEARLTYKGRREGLAREEVEVAIDPAQARLLLDHHCDGRILGKRRHLVPWGALTWEVDVYDAPLAGVTLAEVELPSADHPLVLPDWIGAEVTGDPAWRKINMLEATRR